MASIMAANVSSPLRRMRTTLPSVAGTPRRPSRVRRMRVVGSTGYLYPPWPRECAVSRMGRLGLLLGRLGLEHRGRLIRGERRRLPATAPPLAGTDGEQDNQRHPGQEGEQGQAD